MTRPHSEAPSAAPRPERRNRTTLAAFVLGVPLAAGVLALIHAGPLRTTVAHRYVSHPVEGVEVVMFCCALGALAAKLWNSLGERRRASGRGLLPLWDGQTVPVTEASRLLAVVNNLPRRTRQTLMGQRTIAVLDFLRCRGSAAELDDQLRSLADNDALALEGSYALTRFITWAIPILGFLGTVLGITGAISGVTPEVLENSLSTVTDGLALAFDTTALALGLTMLTMFLSFIVERVEQNILDEVDRYAERELAHRFERDAQETSEFVAVVRRNSDTLVEAMEKLVQRQTQLWADAFRQTEQRRAENETQASHRVAVALETALEKTLEQHAKRLAALEKQTAEQNAALLKQMAAVADTVRQNTGETQSALAQVAQSVASQVDAIARLQEGDKHLRRLQETLNQNLASLAGAGAFEQALHSLTAAVHLLTARAAPAPAANRLGPRPGNAA